MRKDHEKKDRSADEVQAEIKRQKAMDERDASKKLASRLDAARCELEKMRTRCATLERRLRVVEDESHDYERLVEAANIDICLMQTRIEQLRARLAGTYRMPACLGNALRFIGLAW